MMYGSWDMERHRQNSLSFWTILPSYPTLKKPKNQNFEKMKKTHGDIIILHKYTTNDNPMMYGSWDMKCDGQNFLSFWTIFCPFTPETTQQIKILKKWKKTPGGIIILHTCTKNHDHMLYCSSDMMCDGCNYFSFWTIFCPFTPLTAQKIKILKKWKKHLEISSFYTSVPKIMIICYTVPEIWYVTDVIVIFYFGFFPPFYPPNSPKNQNLKKV